MIRSFSIVYWLSAAWMRIFENTRTYYLQLFPQLYFVRMSAACALYFDELFFQSKIATISIRLF